MQFRQCQLSRVALLAVLTASTACIKKGSGVGTRAERPGFSQSGTIFQNGPTNQAPTAQPGQSNTPGKMDPQALSILAACYGLDASSVVQDPAVTVAKAQQICAELATVGYKKDTILNTTEPVAVND